MNKLTVIDIFCGAGGFSEGFRQQDFEIAMGIDKWQPAIDTFNHNFNINCSTKDVLDFGKSVSIIESLPDTDIIIGSPPCVSFSSSNKSGKADKSLGLQLTECFLRIVAVKKYKPNSKLKAWFMENVVNSKKYLQSEYTFEDLNLTEWAKSYKITPTKIAINLLENSHIINSADYGSIQIRKRAISGEIIKLSKFIVPPPTNRNPKTEGTLPPYKTLQIIKEDFPSPFEKKSNKIINDPSYSISLEKSMVTDHFYDTGIYKCDWQISKYLKENHPYMGKMSFPENISSPSRTVTATKIGGSREALIYQSEIYRKGNGEFRTPTVREAAIIMGFPITYQFLGSENTKWRLVGNAVCPSVSRALAKTVRNILELPKINIPRINEHPKLEYVQNLNTFSLKVFNNPPKRKIGSRFRRHTIKDGNLTVTLSNYDIEKNSRANGKWYTSIQYGTGKGFPIQKIKDNFYEDLSGLIKKYQGGKDFLSIINNGFTEKISSSSEMQKMYEQQKSIGQYKDPTELVDEIAKILERINVGKMNANQDNFKVFKYKDEVPIKQLFALYAINKISTIANSK